MDKEALIRRYSRLLEYYGFSGVSAFGMRSSFDIISEKRGKLTILKFVDNIDSLAKSEAETLKKLNGFFDADVFVVFKNYKGDKGERRAIFNRHGIDCVSQDCLETLLGGSEVPRAQKFIKTKYRINPVELKKLRGMQNMSMRKLSAALDVSKDTIYRYEHSSTFATGPTLRKLERFFKTEMAEPSDVSRPRVELKYHHMNPNLDVNFTDVGAAPFHVLGKKHSRYEISNTADARTMKKIAAFYADLSTILEQDYPFFMAGGSSAREVFDGIPVLTTAELKRIRDEKELIDLISGKRK
jgi:predicted transcriptional regulator